MKIILVLLLYIPCLLGLNISQTIEELQASEQFVLDQTALANTASYQSLARSAAVHLLPTSSTASTVKNFYALACIYYATNGAPNPRTEIAFPGCPVPTWTTDNWLFGAYCTWYGITCDGSNNVVAIDLKENNLHGRWPSEVVLLQKSLQSIQVSNNAYLYSKEHGWLSRMTELRFLYFGSTSWEYAGVPSTLGGATKLGTLYRCTLWVVGLL